MTQQTDQNHWHETVAKGFEPNSMRVGGFGLAVTSFIGFMALMFVALHYVVRLNTTPRPAVDDAVSVVSSNSVPSAPLTPPLQPSPRHDRLGKEDLQSMYSSEDDVFAALGWNVDRTSHHATPPRQLVDAVAERFRAIRATHVPPAPGDNQGETR